VAQKTIGGLNFKFTQQGLHIDLSEILHKADSEVKKGSQGALYQLVTDYFQQKDRRDGKGR